MPDRAPFDLNTLKARQAAAREQAAADYANPDTHDQAHLRRTEITNCHLCDDDGYRGMRVCDHREHFTDTSHGRALVQAELNKIQARRQGRR